MAATIIIREHGNVAPGNYSDGGNFVPGALVTDGADLPIKTVATVVDAPKDSAALTPKTYFVEIEASADVRYAVRPKGRKTALPATANHSLIKSGVPTLVRVYPSAIINFLEVAAP